MFLIELAVLWDCLGNKMILQSPHFAQQFSSKTKENSIIRHSKKTQKEIRTSVQLFLLFKKLMQLKIHFVVSQSTLQTCVERRRAVCSACLVGLSSLQESQRRRGSVILNYCCCCCAANAESCTNKPENRRRRNTMSVISDCVLHDTLRSALPLRCAILQKA